MLSATSYTIAIDIQIPHGQCLALAYVVNYMYVATYIHWQKTNIVNSYIASYPVAIYMAVYIHQAIFCSY